MNPMMNQLNALSSWMKLAVAYTQMSTAAGEVVFRRTLRMSQGTMTASEACGMVMEKATAFAESAERAVVAAATGADPVRIATAALHPIRAKACSNVRKLRG